MAKRIIIDWCQFCEGKNSFDKSHFYTLFWEDISQNDLKEIFKYFPNPDGLFLFTNEYLFGKTRRVSESVINKMLIELALGDLNEKKNLIDSNSNLSSMLNDIKVEFINDNLFVETSRNNIPYVDFFDTISDKLMDSWIIEDKKTFALYEAFYGLTKNYEMVWYLFKPLFSIDINLECYFQFTSLGGIYSLIENKLIVSKKA